ncbi:Ger(x)C family spore germination protein [Paenibacillus piri]|uniref:Ger(X)C family spore germination protein n=1 Tax=Paenibacillus piri TaxID=2547395 RepID=A0A4R5KSY9_9BACL|nr:Ger(x)C family spore germination protein [Paenibacillus piri]TDF97977.1 Ger(x)C family spore germination protein [Paenibacillus piri]
MISRHPVLKFVLIVCLLSLQLLVTGCWDRREIEERTSVVGIAIDKSKKHPSYLLVTVQIPIPIKIAGASGGRAGGGKQAVRVMSSEGKTVVEGFQNLQKRLNQELFYGHTRVIAIGEEAAREGVNHIFDPFRRDPQLRRLLWPLIVKGEARELLKAGPNLEQIPIVYVMTLIENGAKAGRIPDMNLGKFYIDLTSRTRDPYLNYIQVVGDDIRWEGIAVFRGVKMVGVLPGQDAWQMLRIRERRDGGNITFPYQDKPDQLITINTEFIRSRNEISYINDHVVVKTRIFLEGNLLEKTFGTNLFKSEEMFKIENDAVKYLEKEAKVVIGKLQKQYHADILGLGSKIRSYHPDIWKKLDWKKDFSKVEIQVSYDMKLRSSGMEMR